MEGVPADLECGCLLQLLLHAHVSRCRPGGERPTFRHQDPTGQAGYPEAWSEISSKRNGRLLDLAKQTWYPAKVACSMMLSLPLLLSLHPAMAPTRAIVITRSITLDRNALLNARLVLRASHVVIDGSGATLVGPAHPGEPASYENAGVGVQAEGVSDVTLHNLKVKGFATGLAIAEGRAWRVERSDFSDNHDNPQFGWGGLPPRGGIRLTRVHDSIFEKNKANRVWNGLDLLTVDAGWCVSS
jgi:hypothetical protein